MKTIEVNVFYPTKPHAGQLQVLTAFDTGTRFVLLRAGRKFRKTSLMISWLIEMALKTGLTCPYIAPNRVQAKNIAWGDHIPRLLTHFRKQGLEYKQNEQELSVQFPNRGKLQLLGVDNPDAIRGISNWGAAGLDEYDDWEEDIWPTIVRPNLMTHQAPALVAGTPKGFRNIYHLQEAENPTTHERLFKSFHFTSHENPELDVAELAALEQEYKAMGEGYYRQEILAEYEKPAGTVYGEWPIESHYRAFEYDPNLPLHLSWDFGVNDPTAVLFIQPNGSELRLVDYYEASNANMEHFTQVIASKNYRTPALETGDIAGNARELVSGRSPIAELARLGHYVRTMAIPSIRQQIGNAHKYIPRLYVSSSNPACERFMQCLVNYRYPEVTRSITETLNEKPIHDQYSHAMRAWEYYAWNIAEPSQQIDKRPPVGSIGFWLQQKQNERYLKEEYVGY